MWDSGFFYVGPNKCSTHCFPRSFGEGKSRCAVGSEQSRKIVYVTWKPYDLRRISHYNPRVMTAYGGY